MTGSSAAGGAATVPQTPPTPEQEEPEEEVSFEDLEERAKSGDAKAQTKVSDNDHTADTVDFSRHMVMTEHMS